MTCLSEITKYSQLETAWHHVKRKRKVTPGIDLIRVEEFERNLKRNLQSISIQAENGKYKFNLVVEHKIPKKIGSNDKRPIRIYTIRDKVLQTSIRMYLEDYKSQKCIFPEIYNKVSVGYIDKNYYKGDSVGVKLAVDKIKKLYAQGYRRFMTADIKDFFEVINKKKLLSLITGRLPDNSINYLLDQLLNPQVIEKDRFGINKFLPQTSSGVAQGSVISPLFSNIYLMSFDKELEKNNINAVRYADDVLIATKSASHTKKTLRRVKQILLTTSNLEFHPDGSTKGPKIYNINYGLNYLGINITKTKKNNRWCIQPSQDKIDYQLLKISDELSVNNKNNLVTRVSRLNNSITSWFSTYNYVGCSKKELSKAYSILKEKYISQINHLLLVKKIAKSKLGLPEMEFLGILPPKIKLKRR